MSRGSANFGFLAAHDQRLAQAGALAEYLFPIDPVAVLVRLRQFGEFLAREVANRSGLPHDQRLDQADLLRILRTDGGYDRQVLDLFHQLRIAGNRAAHDGEGDHGDALECLKFAWQLGVWFHRTFTDRNFKSGKFRPPPAPADADADLETEIARLKAERDALLTKAQRAEEAAAQAAAAQAAAEAAARQSAEDSAFWERLASEFEAANALRMPGAAEAPSLAYLPAPVNREELLQITEAAAQAAAAIDLDESATRSLIDEQLRERGWEVDSRALRFAKGARPAKGRNTAIAEWPTRNGPADYALFVGTVCVALVEAKRKRKNVSAAVDQAGRYAQGFKIESGKGPPEGGPWAAQSGQTGEPPYQVPFLFATNGRPYLQQIETESGIWFRDARLPTNLRRALTDWPTPEGLMAQLSMDRQAAQQALRHMPMEFGFPLRDYQQRAIRAVEAALEDDERRTKLLAMATGTGKTKLSIALLYRLLEARRFRRVCFVVDRSALGEQAAGEFKTTRIVSARTFADIFGLKELADTTPETATKVHICTIQGLVKRVLFAAEPADVPPVDQYDLMVIDECHRGYLLDREMTDAEMAFRSEADYVSKYRRVIEHFDAVKIGLTATPALHTVSIFGDPIFTYSYREAVIDGNLVDHEPPTRIETELARNRIRFKRGEQLPLLDTRTGQIDLTHAPDDLEFEVDEFNRKVITRPFNRTVCEEVARQIDPSLPGKTLIFAATDGHADIVVDELKKAFAARYDGIDDTTVVKITGSIDDPQKMIRRFRNDALPKVAVTVDLLTTGIDVPKIVNLVFLRRVASRILYEQMLGRATRLCPEIDKQSFRIFDAVGLYDALENMTEMRPVAADPKVSLTQLLKEFAETDDTAHRTQVRDQILAKLQRRLRRMSAQTLEDYEVKTGESLQTTMRRLKDEPPDAMATWFRRHAGIGPILDWNPEAGGSLPLPISEHGDSIHKVWTGYGELERPEDFLDAFSRFVRDNVNKIAALQAVVQRPRALTRADLKAIRAELDSKGFSEANLHRAWLEAKNQDIAAQIIGHIRQAALGDPLLPFADRVNAAMARILARHPWTQPQRQWLERIGKAAIQAGVIDQGVLDEGQFRETMGGFARLNKVFDGKLDAILGDLNEEIWKRSA